MLEGAYLASAASQISQRYIFYFGKCWMSTQRDLQGWQQIADSVSVSMHTRSIWHAQQQLCVSRLQSLTQFHKQQSETLRSRGTARGCGGLAYVRQLYHTCERNFCMLAKWGAHIAHTSLTIDRHRLSTTIAAKAPVCTQHKHG